MSRRIGYFSTREIFKIWSWEEIFKEPFETFPISNGVKQFGDLICWQRARELTKFIYDISKYQNFEIDRGLQDQIRRAAVSVMSNIAEGFDRGTKLEFVNYLFIAKGSCGEVKCQLYISFDIRYIDISKFQHGIKLCDEVSRLIQSFIFKLKSGAQSGLQYKHAPRKDGLSEFVEAEKEKQDIKFIWEK